MKTKILILLMLVVWCTTLYCMPDHLVVKRFVTIKEDPKRDANIVDKVKPGDCLELLSSEQTNGYFYVQIPNTTIHGWVYRTFVRRYEGATPSADPIPLGGYLVSHVIDVGAGLCIVTKLPTGNYILYDAGHYEGYGKPTFDQIKEVMPVGSTIEEVIISHTDGDHIGAASYLFENYKVKKIVDTGFDKSCLNGSRSATYRRFLEAIPPSTKYVNLHEKDSIIIPGTTETFGDTKLVFLCGFGKPLDEWNLRDESEQINSVSIVVKIVYKGASILLSGDAIGRNRNDQNSDCCIATEKYLVDHASTYLKSDIAIAPHHGGNNANSTEFVYKVSPSVVIFSAGHKYFHPYECVVERYEKFVDSNHIFRTDRGDDEREGNGSCPECELGRIPDCIDSSGDDDIEIIIDAAGKYSVKYVKEDGGSIG